MPTEDKNQELRDRLAKLNTEEEHVPEAPKNAKKVNINRMRPFKLTAGELRNACKANPDHPLSAEKLKSVASLKIYNKVKKRKKKYKLVKK